jgi:hypothetical protein
VKNSGGALDDTAKRGGHAQGKGTRGRNAPWSDTRLDV